MLANILTVSRMLGSLALLFFPPSSVGFGVIYLLCGVSDMLDGFFARRLHTESEAGARLDSAADLLFAAAYAVKLLPILRLPWGLRLWAAVIALTKGAGILLRSGRARGLRVAHSLWNKLTGLAAFLLPLTVRVLDGKYGAALVCLLATAATAEEYFGRKTKK